MIIAHIYLLCLVFAEEQGAAMPEMVPVHTERGQLGKLHCSGPSRCTATHPQTSAAGLLYAISRASPALEPREKTLLAAVPQHSLLPTRAVPHVPEGASSGPILRGGTACAYFHAAIILAAGLDQALQQLEHSM